MNQINSEFLECLSSPHATDSEKQNNAQIIAWYTEENIIQLRNKIKELINKLIVNNSVHFCDDNEHDDFVQYYLCREHMIGEYPVTYNEGFRELGRYVESMHIQEIQERIEGRAPLTPPAHYVSE